MRFASVFAVLALVGCTQNLPDNIGPNCEADGLADCGRDACVDLNSDSENCGACNTACVGPGETCVVGNCEVVCPGGQINCAGTCVDPQSNDQYCGARDECVGPDEGETCEGGYSCNEGACACVTPYIECAPGTCVNVDTDVAHCGACFDACPPDATGCMNGACTFEVIVAGALPPSNGRWQYGSEVGVVGADEQCAANWELSSACNRAQLEAAELTGELAGLADVDGTTVAAMWIDDETADDVVRCVDNTQENLPWTYETAHIGGQGYYAVLNGDGTLGDVTVGACNEPHHTVCCY